MIVEMTVEQDQSQYYWLCQVAERPGYWMLFWARPAPETEENVIASAIVVGFN